MHQAGGASFISLESANPLYVTVHQGTVFKTLVQEPVSLRLQRDKAYRERKTLPIRPTKKGVGRTNFHTDKPPFRYKHQKTMKRREIGSPYKSCLSCSQSAIITELLRYLSFVKVFSFTNSIKQKVSYVNI